jgi:hypothetical protein
LPPPWPPPSCTTGRSASFGIDRQPVDAADDLDQCVLHVRADGEGQVDEAAAGTGVAVEFLETRQALQHLLLRFEQFGLDFLGRGGAPVGLDRDLRAVDVGEQLQR